MRCPYCKKTLKGGPRKVYETLTDHVLFTNEDPPERATFICNCSPELFWDECGDIYCIPTPSKKLLSALGSISEHIKRTGGCSPT